MRVSDIKTDRQLRIVYITAVAVTVLYWLFPIYTTVDTATYQSAYSEVIKGNVDSFRPPVYPLFIGVMDGVFGKTAGSYLIVFIQQLLFILSAGYFLKMMKSILPERKNLPFLTSLFYILYPGISSWTHSIMSEPMAIIFTVFTVYWIVDICLKKATVHNISMLTVFLILALFTRPSFLFLIPLVTILCVILAFKKRIKDALKTLPAIVIPIVLLLFYCGAMQERYGVFSPSEIGTINQFWALRQGHVIQPVDIKTDGLRAELEASYAAEKLDRYPYTVNQHTICDWSFDMNREYGTKALDDAVKNAISRSPADFIKDVVIRFTNSSHSPVSEWAVNLPMQITPVQQAFDIHFGLLYWILIAYAIMMLVYIKRKMELPLVSVILFLMVIGGLSTILMGAPRSFGRLFVPLLPVAAMLTAQLLSLFRIKVTSPFFLR